MPTDARSPNRNYPVPNAANLISEDFPRLITALLAIDTDVHGLLSSVAARALLVHTHAIADVSGLQAALDGKLPVGTTYTLAGLTDVNVTGASTGQFLVRGPSQWQPATVTPATIGALPAASVSAFGGTLIDDADAAAARATLQLGSSALTSDDRVAYGDANATIAANARVVAVNVALTAARTLTLPAANAAGAPPYIIIVDEARGITATNKLTIQRAGSDTINGVTSIELTSAGAAVILTRNGTNAWTAISTGGGGAGVLTAYRYVATSNQTSFSGADANGFTLSYVPGGLFVSVNGVTQTPNTYTASSGSAVVFSSGLTTGDVVLIYAVAPFAVADAWTKVEADARFSTPSQVAATVAPFAYRNRIVNPAMQISQERGTALVDVTTGGVYTVDQWIAALSTTPGGTLRAQQVASVTPAGSPFRLRYTVQVADASIAAGDSYTALQFIEGQMIADARFGTASASQVVIRFGVRSSIAGTFGVRLTNSAGNRSYVTTITIAGGEINTDLLRTVVIPGDTSGTWLTDTGIGLSLQVTLASGTTFQTTAGSWQAGNFTTTSAQTNFMGTASATFELFDVGLYVDALAIGVAPPFEVPDFSDELMRCLRYWENGIAISYTAVAGVGQVQMTVPFKQIKRVAPVIGALTGAHSAVSIATTEFGVNITSTLIDTPWTASARF